MSALYRSLDAAEIYISSKISKIFEINDDIFQEVCRYINNFNGQTHTTKLTFSTKQTNKQTNKRQKNQTNKQKNRRSDKRKINLNLIF